MKRLIITEEERSRILGMHQNATSRQYLMEEPVASGDTTGRVGELTAKWDGKNIAANLFFFTNKEDSNFKQFESKDNYKGSPIIEFELSNQSNIIAKAYPNINYRKARYKFSPNLGVWFDQNNTERTGPILPYTIEKRFQGDQTTEWDNNYPEPEGGMKQLSIPTNSPFVKDIITYLKSTQVAQQPQKM